MPENFEKHGIKIHGDEKSFRDFVDTLDGVSKEEIDKIIENHTDYLDSEGGSVDDFGIQTRQYETKEVDWKGAHETLAKRAIQEKLIKLKSQLHLEKKSALNSVEKDLQDDFNKRSFDEVYSKNRDKILDKIKELSKEPDSKPNPALQKLMGEEISDENPKSKYEKFRDFLENELDYKTANWLFSEREGRALWQAVKARESNQEIYSEKDKSFEFKLNQILDFDSDGLVESEKSLGASESQLRTLITNQKRFENLLGNIGSDLLTFNLEFKNDPEAAKVELQKKINWVLKMTGDAAVLSVPNGVKDFLENYNEEEKK